MTLSTLKVAVHEPESARHQPAISTPKAGLLMSAGVQLLPQRAVELPMVTTLSTSGQDPLFEFEYELLLGLYSLILLSVAEPVPLRSIFTSIPLILAVAGMLNPNPVARR